MTDPAEGAKASSNGAPKTGNSAMQRPHDGRPAESAKGQIPAGAKGFDGSENPQGKQDRRSDNSNSQAEVAPGGEADISHRHAGKKRRRRRARRGKNRQGIQSQNQPSPSALAGTAASSPGTNGADSSGGQPSHSDHGARAEGPHTSAVDPKAGKDQPAKQRGQKHWKPRRDRSSAPLYAALDLGTNNCRLLVALPTRPGQFRVIDAFSRIVRLGEGLGATGRLSKGAMDRAVEALKVCAAKLENKTVRRHRLIATEACRSAGNGAEFLDRVKNETGLDLEIVDRETEARLAVSGCSSLVGRETSGVVLFDIGGGSSEIAAIDLSGSRSNRLANHISAWTSLPVGVVTLSERHGGREVTQRIFADMVDEVAGLLDGFVCPDIPGCDSTADGSFHLLGTSGTVTTLAGVHLELPRYDRRQVDGLWLSSDEVDRMTEKILSWDFHARSSNPCIGADRADLVLAGCAILEAIRRRWPSERLRVADRGLREGLLTEMMAADGIWRRGRGRRPYAKRNPGINGQSQQRTATRRPEGSGQ